MGDESNHEDAEVLEEEPRNILLGMIRQLSYGMDLHRVTFPTFVLEPRSMLERITDFFSHTDLVVTLGTVDDPLQRIIGVLRYFMSGWHIRPKGVKKPYNPVLGEHFKCRYKLEDGSDAFYVAEQVSHHPPISAYFYANPTHGVLISGHLAPKSRFLGNSVASIMEGRSTIRFLNRPNETYVITMPNMYARNILIGTIWFELADKCSIKCEATNLTVDLDFKAKGFFTGTYNWVEAKVKRDGYEVAKMTGKWSDELFLTLKDGTKSTLFDPTKAKVAKKVVPTEDQQEEFESRRLWAPVTAAILARDQTLATTEKSKIEDHQRKLRQERTDGKTSEFVPRFFKLAENEIDWDCLLEEKGMTNDHFMKKLFGSGASA